MHGKAALVEHISRMKCNRVRRKGVSEGGFCSLNTHIYIYIYIYIYMFCRGREREDGCEERDRRRRRRLKTAIMR
jgi:hypothetical protein